MWRVIELSSAGNSKIASDRPVGRARVRDPLRRTILDHPGGLRRLGRVRGVGRLGHGEMRRLGGRHCLLLRTVGPSHLFVRDVQSAVGARRAQDVEDRVIGDARGFGQSAEIPG